MNRFVKILTCLLVGMVPLSLAHADETTYGLCGLVQSKVTGLLDGDFTFTFKLCADATSSDCPWEESQSVTVTDGSFCVNLGATEPLPDPTTQLYFVEMIIDNEVFNRFEITSVPVARLASVALALAD